MGKDKWFYYSEDKGYPYEQIEPYETIVTFYNTATKKIHNTKIRYANIGCYHFVNKILCQIGLEVTFKGIPFEEKQKIPTDDYIELKIPLYDIFKMIGYPEYTINVKTGRVPVNIGILMTRSKDIAEIDAPDVTASAVLAEEPSPTFIIGINDLFVHYHQQSNSIDKIFSLAMSFSFCFSIAI